MVAAIDSSSWLVIKPVVSCEPTILTLTRTSEPVCNTLPSVLPRALALKIFSTAVKPWPSCDTSLGGANTGVISTPNASHANVCNFLPKTMAYELPAFMNSTFCGVNDCDMSTNSSVPASLYNFFSLVLIVKTVPVATE